MRSFFGLDTDRQPTHKQKLCGVWDYRDQREKRSLDNPLIFS
ncbi:hypothetical protein [Nostoc edaphicum]|nr:hypothetical protein [Nostoc edaphicum]